VERDLLAWVRIADVRDDHIDGPRDRVAPHRNREEASAQARRKLLDLLGERHDLTKMRCVVPSVGGVGELVLKGPSMCSGYFNDEAATKEAIDAQGWFHTGDLARRDTDGFYTNAGRKKDMFITGGENVYPLELETALYEHPAVQQCAVVGVPDPKWGEVGRAFVVLKPGSAATSEELLTHLRERVARFKVPKKVELMERLPVSAAGKILKRELREAAIAADARG
jgi:fatty-acyl-CoA synthase